MKYIKLFIHYLLIFLLCFMIASITLFCAINLKWYSIIAILLLFLLTIIGKKKINFKQKYITFFVCLLILIGLLIRIYLLVRLKIMLKSDFSLYYNTALGIINHKIPNPDYLAYNYYVYIFSKVLSIFLKIFGLGVKKAIVFNFVCQILTLVFLFLIVKKQKNKKLIIWPAIWFIMPNVIYTTYLVSTENLFILLLTIILYCLLLVNDNVILKKKYIVIYFLLGILIGFTNFIRPLMLILLIAYVFAFVTNNKMNKKLLVLPGLLLGFIITISTMNQYVYHKIGIQQKSGSFTWSMYFGANYNRNGYWNEPDALTVAEVLNNKNGNKKLTKMVIDRYKGLGLFKTGKLYLKKYYCLWGNINGNSVFLKKQLNKNGNIILKNSHIVFDIIGVYLMILTIIHSITAIKNKNDSTLFLELFSVLYILANLFVVVNERYSYPLLIMMIIICLNSDISLKRVIKK